MPRRCLDLLLSIAAAGIILLAEPLSAEAGPNCTTETSALKRVADEVRIDIEVPSNLIAGDTINVAWHSKKRAPIKSPVFVVVAIDGEVRIEAPPLPPPPKTAPDD